MSGSEKNQPRVNSRFLPAVLNAHDDSDEVNDKIADDNDDDHDDDGISLSLDRWFMVHAYINRARGTPSAQHDRSFCFVDAIFARRSPRA